MERLIYIRLQMNKWHNSLPLLCANTFRPVRKERGTFLWELLFEILVALHCACHKLDEIQEAPRSFYKVVGLVHPKRSDLPFAVT